MISSPLNQIGGETEEPTRKQKVMANSVIAASAVGMIVVTVLKTIPWVQDIVP